MILIIISLFPGICLFAQDKPQVIAHRGYWQTTGSAQNSIASLENAARINVYGSEFDVHMTQDSVLIIFHDDRVNGIRFDEAPYSAIQNIVLSNGEKIPTLREYLEAAKHLENIKLIFELKTVNEADPEWNRESVRRSVELVREKELQLRTEYITFDLDAAKEFIRLAPESDVYYLNGDLSPAVLKSLGFAGLDYHFDVMRANLHWFQEAKSLGLLINVWTVNDMTIMREMIDYGVDFITTDFPNEALQLISSIESAAVESEIPNLAGEGMQVYIQNGMMYVSRVQAGATLRVYNIPGTLVAPSISPKGGEFVLPLPGRGVYIVTDGREVIKVIE